MIVLALAFFAVACERGGGEGTAALDELDRLAFVPTGRVPAAGASVDDDLLVDVFEVTREEWRTFLAATQFDADDDWKAKLATWPQETARWPASWMTRDEALRFASSRGMRLPTSVEWLALAAGPQGRLYPWGDTRFDSVANTLELGLLRPVAVGSFESGRTPAGVYDVVGNVWEWCSDALPSLSVDGGKSCVFGGSYLYYARPIYSHTGSEYYALALEPASRADDIGVRLVVSAREYLWRRASSWGDGASVRARLQRVGERFGPSALPLLDELAARPGAPSVFSALIAGARP
ncbi:MAG: formylglycine-generating enzyme family protein [Planctomycetes bacterium]|nr:formylglycine-generating enzyme family protein [Planctomycetota bacterium]